MSPRAWSNEQIETLRVLFLAGDDDVAIAEKMTRMFSSEFSRSKVIGKRLRLGLYREGAFAVAPKATRVPPAKKAMPTEPKPAPTPPKPKRILPVRPPDPEPTLTLLPRAEMHTVPLPLVQRKRHQCGWPLNDGGPFLFCCQPKAPGDKTYCGYHRELSLPRDRRRRRAAA